MCVLRYPESDRVFYYFEKISSIPRGSGNMKAISEYCVEFAKSRNLKVICDEAKNVIIFKEATAGYENAEPIILQGHLDMVCQKTPDSDVDFEKDGISLKVDGDTIYADGTTLGADNGIAVAMILSILESENLSHPKIEAVLTTDEEIGMIGASKLDISVLSAKRMINIDCEEEDCITVSCAGGSDFAACLKSSYEKKIGTQIAVTLKGLKGGHSGICIHEGRGNANILAGRFLKMLRDKAKYDIISINGGDKGNAIPLMCEIHLCAENSSECVESVFKILTDLKNEIQSREPLFDFKIDILTEKECTVFSDDTKNEIIYALTCTPNGVIDMSADIDGLVETSLNLGILKTEEKQIYFGYALRSNKKIALRWLENKMTEFFSVLSAETNVFGQYPPWEFNKNSKLQQLYRDSYFEKFGKEIRVEAIHAGLECGIFADKIEGFDCIAIGPDTKDVHTVKEHLSASSVARVYSLLKDILAKCL